MTNAKKQEIKELTEKINLLTKRKHELTREIEGLETEIGRTTIIKTSLLGQQTILKT
jgi:hypothetical protein